MRRAAKGPKIWRDKRRDRMRPQPMMMTLAVPTMKMRSVWMTFLAMPSRMPVLAMKGVFPAAMIVVPLWGDEYRKKKPSPSQVMTVF